MIEQLEERRLFAGQFNPYAYGAAVPVQDGGVLTITNAHSIQINAVYDSNENVVDGAIQFIDKGVRGNKVWYFSSVTLINVTGTKDYDIISGNIDGSVSANFYGGAGNDTLSAFNWGSGDFNVYGGTGNDSIGAGNGGTGTTTVYGQAGRDTFIQNYGGATFIQ
jgi:hypothetical protein